MCLDIFARSLGTDQGELYEAGTKDKKNFMPHPTGQPIM